MGDAIAAFLPEHKTQNLLEDEGGSVSLGGGAQEGRGRTYRHSPGGSGWVLMLRRGV